MHPWLKAVPKLLAYVVGMIAFGTVAGLLVKWLSKPQLVYAWLDAGAPVWPVDLQNPFWANLIYGGTYSLAMWGTTLGMRRVAYHFIPITHWRHIVWHVLIISTAVVIAFFATHRLNEIICLWLENHVPSSLPVGLIMVISFGATLVITTILYSVDFYRAMRNAEKTALVAELRALRAQINPHFLFNTLNSIAALVHSRPNEAEHVVEELAALFRYTLKASQNPTVLLAEELRAADRYIDIEKARFRDRMTVSRQIDKEALDAMVPSLLIQPLVENAVKHGVSQTEDNCGVLIEVVREKEEMLLRIRDTGPGFTSTDPDVVFSNGTGLANVRDRMYLHFGNRSVFRVLPDGVELRFPYLAESEKQADMLVEIYHKHRER